MIEPAKRRRLTRQSVYTYCIFFFLIIDLFVFNLNDTKSFTDVVLIVEFVSFVLVVIDPLDRLNIFKFEHELKAEDKEQYKRDTNLGFVFAAIAIFFINITYSTSGQGSTIALLAFEANLNNVNIGLITFSSIIFLVVEWIHELSQSMRTLYFVIFFAIWCSLVALIVNQDTGLGILFTKLSMLLNFFAFFAVLFLYKVRENEEKKKKIIENAAKEATSISNVVNNEKLDIEL